MRNFNHQRWDPSHLLQSPIFSRTKVDDWAYVHFEEMTTSGEAIERYYPSKILGFITISGTPEAVIQCSEKPLIWSDLEKTFL